MKRPERVANNLVVCAARPELVRKVVDVIDRSPPGEAFEYLVPRRGELAAELAATGREVIDAGWEGLFEQRRDGDALATLLADRGYLEVFLVCSNEIAAGYEELIRFFEGHVRFRLTVVYSDLTCTPGLLMDTYLPVRFPLALRLALAADAPPPEALDTAFYAERSYPPHTSDAPRWEDFNVLVEITRLCNFSCPHCSRTLGMAGEEQSVAPGDLQRFISDERLTRITLIGAGEPLMHPELPAVAEVFIERGLPVNLLSNGSLLDDRRLGRLLELDLTLLVSLDGADDLHFDRQRKPGALPAIIRRVTAFHAAHPGVPILVNTVVSTENYHHLTDIVELAARVGAEHVSIVNLMALREGDDRKVPYNLSVQQRLDHQVRALRRARELGVRLSGKPIRPALSPCHRAWNQPFITVDGDVVACSFAHMHDQDFFMGRGVTFPSGAFTLGNLHRDSLDDLWRGDRIRRIRRVLLDSQQDRQPDLEEYARLRAGVDPGRDPHDYCRICTLRWRCAC